MSNDYTPIGDRIKEATNSIAHHKSEIHVKNVQSVINKHSIYYKLGFIWSIAKNEKNRLIFDKVKRGAHLQLQFL